MKSKQKAIKAKSRKAVVLTTHERSGYFSAVLGGDCDFRFDSKREAALGDLLHNIVTAGGEFVVVDEAYFINPDDMAFGLEHYVNCEPHPERLKIIVVCSQRYPGDMLLAFLVMYCGIFNVIYGKTGVDIGVELEQMLLKDRRRSDVLQLIDHGRWSSIAKRPIEKSEQDMTLDGYPATQDDVQADLRRGEDIVLDVTNAKLIKINVAIKTKVSY